MPRQPSTDAYRSLLIMLRQDMHATERDMLMFNAFRFDDLAPSERVAFADFANRYRDLLQELCAMCRQQGI
jgi:hypothetical protein